MKRRYNKLMAVLLAVVMLISSTGISFAVENEPQTAEDKDAAHQTTVEELEVKKEATNGQLEPKTSEDEYYEDEYYEDEDYWEDDDYYDEEDDWYDDEYESDVIERDSINLSAIKQATSTSNYKAQKMWFEENLSPDSKIIIPVDVKDSGVMHVDAAAYGYDDYDSMYMYLCDDYEDAIQEDVDFEEYYYLYSDEEGTTDDGMKVTAGNTYYIVIESGYGNEDVMNIEYAPFILPTSDRSLVQGSSKWVVASDADDYDEDSVIYYKVRPTKTGVMTVSFADFDSTWGMCADVKLLNYKKQALSNNVWYDEDSKTQRVYFGVKKKTTYYLKVTNAIGGDNGVYAIKYSMTARTDRALGSKAKAKKLVRYGDPTYSLFVASRSQSTDWYKFYVSSTRTTKIRVNASSIKSGCLYLSVYKNGKKFYSDTIYPNESWDYSLWYNSNNYKCTKGTYYVKIVKGTKASGKYAVRYLR